MPNWNKTQKILYGPQEDKEFLKYVVHAKSQPDIRTDLMVDYVNSNKSFFLKKICAIKLKDDGCTMWRLCIRRIEKFMVAVIKN
jgi:hypothetical protein